MTSSFGGGSAGPDRWRPRVVVCGSGFGRVYLAALRRGGMPFELAGLLARGSDRSKACAAHYKVPLFTDVDELPAELDLACVVVSAGINGGSGAGLAQRLMARGVHVVQEHPLHQVELADCLRQARRQRVKYQLNTNYIHLDAVVAFIGAAQRLLRQQTPLLIDAVTSFQVFYPLVDILSRALSGIHPSSLVARPPVEGLGPPMLRSLDGRIGGVPTTIRIQNQLHPTERDNGAHIGHRITLATEGGDLLLVNSQGPVLWTPRLQMPADYASAITVDSCSGSQLDLPGAGFLTDPAVPSYRRFIRDDWPKAAARALLDLRHAILTDEDPLPQGQAQLAVARLVADVTRQLGRPEPAAATTSARIVEATELVTDAAPNSVTQAGFESQRSPSAR